VPADYQGTEGCAVNKKLKISWTVDKSQDWRKRLSIRVASEWLQAEKRFIDGPRKIEHCGVAYMAALRDGRLVEDINNPSYGLIVFVMGIEGSAIATDGQRYWGKPVLTTGDQALISERIAKYVQDFAPQTSPIAMLTESMAAEIRREIDLRITEAFISTCKVPHKWLGSE
jgi:hypothetical protein